MIATALLLSVSLAQPPRVATCDLLEINTWGSDPSPSTQIIAWDIEFHSWDVRTRERKASRFYKARFFKVDRGLRGAEVVQRGGVWVVRVMVNGEPVEVSGRAFMRSRTWQDVEVEDRVRWGETPPSLSGYLSKARASEHVPSGVGGVMR